MRGIGTNPHEGGVVLVIALLLILGGTIIGIAAMTTSDIEMMICGNQRGLEQIFDAAEAGIDVGISAFFTDAPPRGSVRPPIADRSKAPWGIPASDELTNGCGYTVWITDMEVSGRPPPGYDPNTFRTFYYRIRSLGHEQPLGTSPSQGIKETDQVVGVVYQIE
jgi:hypothetical protein